MKRQRFSIILACLISLTACQSTSGTKAIVEDYLKALQSNDTQRQNQLNCVQNDPLDTSSLAGVSGLKIADVSRATPSNSGASYTSVLVRSGSSTWTFLVWDSDEFYVAHKQTLEAFNRSIQALKSSRQSTGSPVPPLLDIPPRSQISSSEYCVSLIAPMN